MKLMNQINRYSVPVKASVAGALTVVSSFAFADDPVVAGMTALQTQAGTDVAAVAAVVSVICGAWWGISFMKKAYSKAA